MRTLIRLSCLTLLAISAILLAWAAYEYSRLPDVSRLKSANPETTALMALRDREQRRLGKPLKRQQIWVPYGAVSEHLKKAILLGEDAAFFSHGGVDFYEMKETLLRVAQEGEFTRGGSAITMQLARNLYLDPGKNIPRKLKEIAIAWKLERALSKQRIFELYLTVVEKGTR